MDKERLQQSVQKEVRSLLVASKNGLSVQELEQDYRMMIGSRLPLQTLGYKSTIEMLLDMPDVVNVHTQRDGTIMLSAVINDCTRGIADLVAKQKKPSVKARSRPRTLKQRSCKDLMRRGRTAPVLPAPVKSDIRDLLSMSPLLLSEFDKAFFIRFGRLFQYSRYGFYSMFEVLKSVADIVQVKQTRAGSLLVLRKSGTGSSTSFDNFVNHKTTHQPFQREKLHELRPLPLPKNTDETPLMQEILLPPVSQPATTGASIPESLEATESQSHFKNPFTNDSNTVMQHSIEEPLVSVDETSPENSSLRNPFLTVKPQIFNDLSTNPENGSSLNTSFPTEPQNPNISKVKQPQVVETLTAETSEKKDSSEFDNPLQWLETKLENELKLCLVQKGAGACVSPEMRHNIKHILKQHSQGILLSQFPIVYKCYTGKDLPFQQMGFMSVMELVGSLGDFLYMERAEDGQDWRLFNIETQENVLLKPDTNAAFPDWNSVTKTSEKTKPAGIKVCQSKESIWWGPLELLLSSSAQNEIPPDSVRKRRLHCLPVMQQGLMIGVFVENIISPSDFYVRCCGKDTSQKLEDMMIEMRRCYSSECVSERYLVPDHCVSVGEIYALREAGDVWWYRVIVHAIHTSEELDVFYPDFGNLTPVKRSWLRFLKDCYMKLPAQAVPASLCYVRPVENQWSTRAIKRFQQLCACGPLVGLVWQYLHNVLYVFLCDTSSEDDVYLHQLLVNEDLAILVQEARPYTALQKHRNERGHSAELKALGLLNLNKQLPNVKHKLNPYVCYLAQSPDQLQEESAMPQSPEHNQSSETAAICEKEPILEEREETEPCMPYLEAFSTGSDLWDEKCLISNMTTFSNDISNLSNTNPKEQQTEKRTQEQSQICEESDAAGLLPRPLEEFYISLIKGRKPHEKSDGQPSPPAKDPPLLEVVHPTTTAEGGFSFAPEEEKSPAESTDFHLFEAQSYYQQSGYPTNPLLGFQKLHFPRISTTMALGPAARLATSGSLLSWDSNPGKALL